MTMLEMREAALARSQVARRPRRAAAADPIPLWLWVVGGIVALYLVLPTLFVIPMSFSQATTFVFPPKGFTWHLYQNFFTNPAWIGSLGKSFLVGLIVALLATMVGTAASLGLSQLHGMLADFVRTLLMVPIVTPSIVIAISVYISFLQWHLVGTLAGYVLAHAALATPFVVVSVTAALGAFDRQLLRASASLGAPPLRSFLTVTMPLISRGVVTGAVLAFVTSFDEVVIAVFIRSPNFQTLPVQMYNSVTVEIDPTVSAASSLIVIGVSLVFLIGMVFSAKRKGR